MADPGELPMALRAAYMAMHRRTDKAFVKHGVTADQFVLLATLERGGAMTQRELARLMPSDPSTVRAMLVLLEKQGFIERESHPHDARARLVTLTSAGKRKFNQLWKAGIEIRSQMVEAVSREKLQRLVQQLRTLADALNEEETADAPQVLSKVPSSARN